MFRIGLALVMAMAMAHAGNRDAIPVEGLLVRLDAGDASMLRLDDTGRVIEWRSAVPAAPHTLEAPEASRRPQSLRGRRGALRPCVRFDGNDDVLVASAFAKTAESWTAVLVAAPRSNPLGAGGLCSASPTKANDYDPGFTIDLYNATGRFDSLSIEGAGRIGGAIDQMRSSFSFGGLHLLVVERGANEIRVWVDGDEQESRPANAATTSMDNLRIGARYYDGQERHYFDGDVAQFLLYNRVLDPEEHVQLTKSLGISAHERAEELRTGLGKHMERMVAPEVVKSWGTIERFEQYLTNHPEILPSSDLAALPLHKDLKEAVALGMQNMNSMFDADKDNEPYFYSNCQADGTGALYHSVNIGIPHVVGRGLWATMIGEIATGFPFPPDGLATYTRYCRFSFDNPDNLNSYIDPARDNKRFIEFHNMREGLYGLVALIEGRNDAWAREKARTMLVTLDKLTDAEGHWSIERASALGMKESCEGMHTVNAARMIDPLLEYHACTGDALAMKMAGLYARAALKQVYLPDGHFAPCDQSSGHIHSLTSALSGITAYSVLTNDSEMLGQCRKIFDNGLPEYFSSWGWGDEVMPAHPANVVSRGEMNQTGDVIRTAMILGKAVDPSYYEVAERYARSMVLPTQHREEELRGYLRDSPEPKGDFQRDVLKRSIGGWAMQLPNDRMRQGDWPLVTIDITSGATHALAECYRHCLTTEGGATRLNMLFDAENAEFAIRSGLPTEGRIAFEAKSCKTLLVRIPAWVKRSSVKLFIQGKAQPVVMEGAYVRIASLLPGQRGELTFALPCKIERETVDGTEYTTTWIGNQIVAIFPRGAVSPLPF